MAYNTTSSVTDVDSFDSRILLVPVSRTSFFGNQDMMKHLGDSVFDIHCWMWNSLQPEVLGASVLILGMRVSRAGDYPMTLRLR
jgi:hypothetical protein